jgi:hypothetical protein
MRHLGKDNEIKEFGSSLVLALLEPTCVQRVLLALALVQREASNILLFVEPIHTSKEGCLRLSLSFRRVRDIRLSVCIILWLELMIERHSLLLSRYSHTKKLPG